MSSKDEILSLIVSSPKGVEWTEIANRLNLKGSINADKAVREKIHRKVNMWVSRNFGRGEGKVVYSVWIKSIQKWAYRHIESMDRDELTQVRSHVEKSKIRNVKQSKALDHRLLYIDTLMRTKQLDFGESEEGAEQVKKPA